jgi:hypothetical protein
MIYRYSQYMYLLDNSYLRLYGLSTFNVSVNSVTCMYQLALVAIKNTIFLPMIQSVIQNGGDSRDV